MRSVSLEILCLRGNTFCVGGLPSPRYHVPVQMKKHIDFITPGIGLSKRSKYRKEPQKLAKRQFNGTSFDSYGQNYTLADCSNGALPQCISTLYNVPPQTTCHPDNSLGIFEFNSTYVQDDMDLFFKYLAPQIPVGTASNNSLINGVKPDSSIIVDGTTYIPALESNLDFQIAWPLMYPQNLTLISTLMTDAQLASDLNATSVVTQLGSLIETDAIDDLASALDAVSPQIGLNMAALLLNFPSSRIVLAQVVSLAGSLKLQRFSQSLTVTTKQTYRQPRHKDFATSKCCRRHSKVAIRSHFHLTPEFRFLKLGLQGTTILVASGDGGVASHMGTCIGAQNSTFDPAFPAR